MVAQKRMIAVKNTVWVPDRKDIVWIDCNPQVGQEMRDIHPFLVLSPRNFNEKTSLIIGLPMTTADYNADNPFAVSVGQAKAGKAIKCSYVLCPYPVFWSKRSVSFSAFGADPPVSAYLWKLFPPTKSLF